MKPEARVCWKTDWQRLLGGVLALLFLAGSSGCYQAAGADDSVQLKEAQFLTVAASAFTAPPVSISATLLPREGWQTIALPYTSYRDVVAYPVGPSVIRTDWYRLDLNGLAASSEPRYLYIPRWKTLGHIAVYGNGQLLYQSEGSVMHNGYNQPLLVRLNPGEGTQAAPDVLLRIERLQSSGSALSTVWAGSAEALVWRHQLRYFLQVQMPLMGGAAFLAVGFFSLAVWLTLKRDSLYLLFFATSIAAFVRMLHYHIGNDYLLIADEWFQWLTVVSLLWLNVLVHQFLEHLHKRPLRYLAGTLVTIALLISAFTLPGASAWIPSLTVITPLLYLLMIPLALLIFAQALRNALLTRLREVWLMAGWFFVTTLFGAHDVMLQNNWFSPEGIYIYPYGIIGLLLMFTYIMFRRYVGAMGEVESLNANLAQRLQAREAELAVTHQRLIKIKHDQTLSDERQRLMQDMHDGLGSSLISAIRSVEQGGMSDTKVSQILKDCMDDLKLAIDSMEPVEADLLLLLATLRFRLEPRLEGTGVELVWEVQELPALDWLEPSAALHILRIVQESVANVLRHTRATEITVGTAVEGAGVQVSIEDNGQGFDVDKVLNGASGRGLHNQQRRAQAIGSQVAWTSGRTGTRFTLWLPLQRTASAPAQPDL